MEINNVNDCIKDVIHNLNDKIKEQCKIDGSKLSICDISDKIINILSSYSSAFKNDGCISDEELSKINESFDILIDNSIKPKSFFGISILWWFVKKFIIKSK